MKRCSCFPFVTVPAALLPVRELHSTGYHGLIGDERATEMGEYAEWGWAAESYLFSYSLHRLPFLWRDTRHTEQVTDVRNKDFCQTIRLNVELKVSSHRKPIKSMQRHKQTQINVQSRCDWHKLAGASFTFLHHSHELQI